MFPNPFPKVNFKNCQNAFESIYGLNQQRLIASCHDLSDGGLGVALAEMAIGGGLGADINLEKVPLDDTGNLAKPDELMSLLRVACAETPGRFLIEVKEENASEVDRILHGSTWSWIGTVTNDSLLTIRCGKDSVVTQTLVHKLATAWREQSTAQTHGKS